MNDGSGRAAQRPVILDAQAQGGIRVGAILGLTMGDTSPVGRVTLVRSGAATMPIMWNKGFSI